MSVLLNKQLTLVIFTLLIIDKTLSNVGESVKKTTTTIHTTPKPTTHTSTTHHTTTTPKPTTTITTTLKPTTTTSVESIISRCCDGCGCPLFNKNVCGFNGTCFQTFRSKCELNEANSKLLKKDGKFRRVSNDRCEANQCYIPLCETCPLICIKDYRPVCSYSCANKCYKTFSNSCTLKAWNCQHINDQYIFSREGECGKDLILCKN